MSSTPAPSRSCECPHSGSLRDVDVSALPTVWFRPVAGANAGHQAAVDRSRPRPPAQAGQSVKMTRVRVTSSRFGPCGRDFAGCRAPPHRRDPAIARIAAACGMSRPHGPSRSRKCPHSGSFRDVDVSVLPTVWFRPVAGANAGHQRRSTGRRPCPPAQAGQNVKMTRVRVTSSRFGPCGRDFAGCRAPRHLRDPANARIAAACGMSRPHGPSRSRKCPHSGSFRDVDVSVLPTVWFRPVAGANAARRAAVDRSRPRPPRRAKT
jgi:hypothetical protein